MVDLANERKAVIANAVAVASADPNLSKEQLAAKKKKNTDKIMMVLKAVSAMRLTREDKLPNCTLVRVHATPPETSEQEEVKDHD